MANIPQVFVPDLPAEVDALTAAFAYARGGINVGPLRQGTKNPGGVLGKHWPSRTSTDPKMIAAWFAGTDLGVFLHCLGLVVFDVDDPEKVPDWMWPHLATAPFQRSRRGGDPRRGHHLFAVPPGRTLGNSLGTLPRGWGEIRGHGGVIVAAPTRHEAEDGLYAWVRTGAVPVLPEEIASHLPDGREAGRPATSAELDAFLAERIESRKPQLVEPILRRFATEAAGGSRHEACLSAACQMIRESAAGLYPARPALRNLFDAFETLIGTDRDARAEFLRIATWGLGQLTPERVKEVRAKHEPPDLGFPSDPSTAPADDEPAGADQRRGYLPSSFWESEDRADLRRIRDAADARLLCPDALLGAHLARLSAMISPSVRVDTGLGRASLNLFVILLGPSGAGKTQAAKTSRELLPPPPVRGFLDMLPMGSGEGLAETYFGWVEEESEKGRTRKVKKRVRENAFFYADEGEAMTKIMSRLGSTIGETLRSMWVGATTGQQNAAAETRRVLEADTYGLGIVIGFQPSTIGPLLADGGGGTPQRFLFLHAAPLDLPDEPTPWPGAFANAEHWLPTKDLELPADIKAEVWRNARAARLAGSETAELDSHRDLTKAKMAALLAIMDFRDKITADDWEAAGAIWEASRGVRDSLVASAAAAEAAARLAARNGHIETAAAAHVAALDAEDVHRAKRVGRLLTRYVRSGGETKLGSLSRRLASRDRAWFEAGLDFAVGRGWLTVDEVVGSASLGDSDPR